MVSKKRKIKNGVIPMKRLKVIAIIAIFLNLNTENLFSQNQKDPQWLNAQFSLFWEYYKNKDYKNAYPYGWTVLLTNPEPYKRFNIHGRMEDVLWYMRDSVASNGADKKMYTDTTLYFYDLAIKQVPEKAAFYYARKAYVMEVWVKANPFETINVYEKAYELDPNLDAFYLDRLGLLYAANATEENEFKVKALELYSKLANREPNNQTWNSRMERLAENLDQLVEIRRKAWMLEKENLQRAWEYAAVCIQNKDFEKAIEPLEFLTQKSPDVINYWIHLANAYNKAGKTEKALSSYKKITELDSKNRDAYVNIGIIYKEKNQLSLARTFFQKASSVSPDWGYPIFLEATLYAQAARGCGFEFKDKLVYLLAQETYRRARQIDPSIAQQANERIKALENSVPTKEDYFFRKIKSGTVLKIEGECYDWINKTVTVP